MTTLRKLMFVPFLIMSIIAAIMCLTHNNSIEYAAFSGFFAAVAVILAFVMRKQ